MTVEEGTVRRIGRYEVIRKIATGGMAELFLARFVGPGGFEKRCALKRILPQFAADQVFTRMFLNEARVTAMFDHPNVVQIFELGQDEKGQFFIAMELVNGINLRQLLQLAIERDVKIPPELAAFMVSQALDGLAYAHGFHDPSGRALNLVHRDISPQNILVSYDGAVKLVDFGIVKGSSISGETQAGMLKGKIAYMSPEQASGEPMDGRSDLFSLGVCFYELIAQERPFRGVNELMTLKAILDKPPTALTRYLPEVPESLERAIYRALEKDPEDRFTSAREFHLELTAILRECPTPIGRHVVAEFIQSLTEGSTIRFDPRPLRIPRRTRAAGFGTPAAQRELVDPPVPPSVRSTPVDRAATVAGDFTPTPTGAGVAPLASISTEVRAAAGLERSNALVVVLLLLVGVLGAGLVWFFTLEPQGVIVEYVSPAEAPPPIAAARSLAAAEAPRAADPEPSAVASAEPPHAAASPSAAVDDSTGDEPDEPDKARRKRRRRRRRRTEAAPVEAAVVAPPPPAPSERPTPATGKLRLTSIPSGLFVTEGKKRLGTTPLEAELDVGAHDLVLSSRRLGIRRPLRVTIAQRVSQSEKVTVPLGKLKVIARPWAWVWMNGSKMGRTPITFEAYEGRHELRLVNEANEERIQVVDKKGDDEQLVTVKF